MARNVFFSFHYDDIMGVNVVRNSDIVLRRYTKSSGFGDRSLWEELKEIDAPSIKKMIDEALVGTTVTSVLVGQDTWKRRYVKYEIWKSIVDGNGLLAVNIHDVGPDQTAERLPNDHSLASLMQTLGASPSNLQDTVGALGLLSGQNPSNSAGALTNALMAENNGLLSHQPSSAFGLLSKQNPRNDLGALADALMAPQGNGLLPRQPWSALSALFSEPVSSPSYPGLNPLFQMAYKMEGDRIYFFDRVLNDACQWEWRLNVDFGGMWTWDVKYPLPYTQIGSRLINLFHTYSWKAEDGAHCFPDWVESAARIAGCN